MKTKSKIEKQLVRKTNPSLLEVILASKKNEKWREVSGILSGPRRNRKNVNLKEINDMFNERDTVIVPGKVLSMGELDKKMKIVALSFSETAEEKILKSGSKISTILDEIKSNPEAKGVKFLE